MLNHHIQRVNEAEKERIAAEEAHRAISVKMAECSARIATMQKENGRAIKKSRHYFEQRVQFAKVLENQKRFILELETEVLTELFLFKLSFLKFVKNICRYIVLLLSCLRYVKRSLIIQLH